MKNKIALLFCCLTVFAMMLLNACSAADTENSTPVMDSTDDAASGTVSTDSGNEQTQSATDTQTRSDTTVQSSPPATEPPSRDEQSSPPATEPPSRDEQTSPPVTEPAVTEPPSTQKPAQTEPPATDAPESEPKPEVVLPSSYNRQFDADKNGIYNYCPSVMQVSDTERYIYYCTNTQSYNVTDYIACRKGTVSSSGEWVWGEQTIVLSPTDGTWDERHVCDPSVVGGEFRYKGETYSYLMAYLGCITSNSQENDLGIAVAKSPMGPFVKVGNAPLVDFVRNMTIDQSIFQWGVGQPSLINMDKKGSIMLFYTRGDHTATRTIAESWDLSDLDDPKRRSSVKLSESGLKNLNGGADILNNADFVYDSAADVFYASSDCHPNPSSVPDYISSHFRVTSFKRPASYSSFGWKYISTVGPGDTGFARNHNTGILRDTYGHLPNGYITVYYTVSKEGNDSLWSYRIYDYHVRIK